MTKKSLRHNEKILKIKKWWFSAGDSCILLFLQCALFWYRWNIFLTFYMDVRWVLRKRLRDRPKQWLFKRYGRLMDVEMRSELWFYKVEYNFVLHNSIYKSDIKYDIHLWWRETLTGSVIVLKETLSWFLQNRMGAIVFLCSFIVI